jgi:hypothetical protein
VPQIGILLPWWIIRFRLLTQRDICAICQEECCQHFRKLGRQEQVLREFKARLLFLLFPSRSQKILRNWLAGKPNIAP